MKTINAVAGVLFDDHRVLLASRPEGRSFFGCWEFPGGKIELGETAKDALIRELDEEVGVIVSHEFIKHTMFIRQSYPSHIVNLDVMLVASWDSIPCAKEGQELFWQDTRVFCSKSPLLLTTQKILAYLSELNRPLSSPAKAGIYSKVNDGSTINKTP